MERDLAKYWPVFVLPTVTAFAIGFLVPFAMGLYLSFCDFTTLSNATFVGLGNYVRAFEDSGGFTHALWYTALFAGVSTVLINLFGLTVALLLVRGFRGTNLFRTVFFMPNLIGGIVLGWLQAGYMMIIYISGLQSIPGDVSEAAAIDGASAWQALRYVKLPMLMPSITICTFLTLTNGFKLFDQNLALTGGMPSNRSQLLALNIYDTFYGRAGWEGAGQAKAVVFCLIVVAIALLQLRLTRTREVQQ